MARARIAQVPPAEAGWICSNVHGPASLPLRLTLLPPSLSDDFPWNRRPFCRARLSHPLCRRAHSSLLTHYDAVCERPAAMTQV